MDNQKICFIMCSNDEFLAEECQRYIRRLEIPEGFRTENIIIRGAKSIASGYNVAMEQTDAKYKVYLHQDVLLIHRTFLLETIALFTAHPEIGMLGMVGNTSLEENGCPWGDSLWKRRVGEVYTDMIETKTYSCYSKIDGEYKKVVVLDGLLMMTQYDLPWREDLFQGWDFYDCSQSIEFWKNGYQVVVPHMETPWCFHDNDIWNMQGYEKWRKIFVKEYKEWYIKIPEWINEQTMKEKCSIYEELIHRLDPKPKLHLEWNKNVDTYSEGDIEDTIIKMIAENEPENYSDAIYNNFSWSTYYHLTFLRKNILNWYPFEPESEILEIGCGMGAITGMLCDRCKEVTAVELSDRRATAALLRCRGKSNLDIYVGNFNDIDFGKKFDYITLIGVLEYQGNYTKTANPYADFLKTVRGLLKPNGKLLIAIENQYGLKYWCGAREDHTGIPFSGLNQYTLTDQKVKTFSKAELEKLVKISGFQNTYFYYPMPDYKLPTVIYSQAYLPKNANMLNMHCYYAPDHKTLLAEESKLYEDIINNQVFEFFANSFLVECTNSDDIGRVTFASLSSERTREYQIGVRFLKNKQVEKFALGNMGRGHIKNISDNSQRLQERGLKIIESQFIENKLVSSYSEHLLLEDYVLQLCAEDKKEKVFELLDCVYQQILQSSEEVSWEQNILYTLGLPIKPNKGKYGIILKTGYLDMILRNAFWDGKNIYWFDQEWVLENVPVKFILYRLLIEFYNSFPKTDQIISLQSVAERYGLLTMWEEFKILNGLFSNSVLDQKHFEESNKFRSGNSKKEIIKNIEKILQ